MPRSNTDHIKTKAAPSGKKLIGVCEHCGAKMDIDLPISVTGFLAFTRVFIREHRRCRKPAVA